MHRSEKDLTRNWQSGEPPLVSVVCITYNHERFIRDALESIMAQETDFAFSVIIGEDCSSDSTLSIIEDYCRLYPDLIRLIKNEKNLGVVENFFRTIQSAETKYVAICEGDDYWTDTSKLQTQIDFLQNNPDYSMVCHPVAILNETKDFAAVRKTYKKYASGHFTTRDILFGHFIPTPSLVFRRDAFFYADWLPACRNGDIALELIVSLSGPGYFMREKMAVYRQHDDGVTKKGRLPPAEMLDKSLFLFNSFDKLTGGRYSDCVNLRIAKILFFHAIRRLRAAEMRSFIFHGMWALKCAIKGLIARQ